MKTQKFSEISKDVNKDFQKIQHSLKDSQILVVHKPLELVEKNHSLNKRFTELSYINQ